MAELAQTPEAVALMLLYRVADAEDWSGSGGGSASFNAKWRKTRAEILDAYAECLQATKGNRDWSS